MCDCDENLTDSHAQSSACKKIKKSFVDVLTIYTVIHNYGNPYEKSNNYLCC